MKPNNLENHSQKLLKYIADLNPKSSIGDALQWVNEFQEYRDDLSLAHFTILKLLILLGVDETGNLKDKVVASKMLEMDDSIWYAWYIALRIHCGHACGIPAAGFVLNNVPIKLGIQKESAMYHKTTIQNLIKSEDNE